MSFRYVDEENLEHISCPICRSVVEDPVMTDRCFHIFCRPCLMQALEHNVRCPTCRTKISRAGRLEPPKAASIVGDVLDRLIVACTNSEACTWQGPRSGLSGHICASASASELATEPMVNELKGDVMEEAAVSPSMMCSQGTCPHASHGCPFIGERELMAQHLAACPYESIKGFLARNEERFSLLETENALLRTTVSNLTDDLDALTTNMRSTLGTFYAEDGPEEDEDTDASETDSDSIEASDSNRLHAYLAQMDSDIQHALRAVQAVEETKADASARVRQQYFHQQRIRLLEEETVALRTGMHELRMQMLNLMNAELERQHAHLSALALNTTESNSDDLSFVPMPTRLARRRPNIWPMAVPSLRSGTLATDPSFINLPRRASAGGTKL